jgi:hypothetical protein
MTPHRSSNVVSTLFLGALALVLLAPAPQAATAAMDVRCERMLLRAAGSVARCRLRAMARATRSGDQDAAACERAAGRILDRIEDRTDGDCGSQEHREEVRGRADDAASMIANALRRPLRPVGCENVRCPSGTECRLETLEFPTCVNTCADVDCPEGTVCRLVPGICPAVVGLPCPDIAECVPSDACADLGCEPWQDCRLHEESGERYCADTCARCRPGQVCEIIETPCPGPELPCPPVVECKPRPNPCELIDCAENRVCRVDPHTGEGYCADTCRGVECPDGEQCRLVDVDCVRAPCPPVAECRTIDRCLLPPEAGECDAAIPRVYFNARSGRCERFIWGGCGGNENNFDNAEDCEAACGIVVQERPGD